MQKHWSDPSQMGTDGAASLTTQRVTNIWVTARCCLSVVMFALLHSGGALKHCRLMFTLLCSCLSHWCCSLLYMHVHGTGTTPTPTLTACITSLIKKINICSTLFPSVISLTLSTHYPVFFSFLPSLGNLFPLRRQEAVCGHAGKTADGHRREKDVWAVWQHRGVHGAPRAGRYKQR